MRAPHDRDARAVVGTFGVGVSWRPRRHPWIAAFFWAIFGLACLISLIRLAVG